MVGCILPRTLGECFEKGSWVRGYSLVSTGIFLKEKKKKATCPSVTFMAWNEVSCDRISHFRKVLYHSWLGIEVSSGMLLGDSGTSWEALCNSYQIASQSPLYLVAPLRVMPTLISGLDGGSPVSPLESSQQPLPLWFPKSSIIIPQISYFFRGGQVIIF